MSEYLKNSRCEECYHLTACDRWVRHGSVLYDDYDGSYSVDGCPDYVASTDVVEVRHGHWNTTDTILGRCCECSVCGSCPTMEYRYCPYCGAKMDGGKDND